ncbi:hypothetical protein [Paraconexibacter algicola]|uniref:Carotenoid biosynthesis protein n=1 Tax=Paraconexibacter algicola TaxID=2133960 RepID=A0A2T4UL45_9ACTN|nr:hypothetical protein [Paraconexibacter algicola]PTL59940.1 hypothetical protein C7Y72_09930 [Paraconexibacter algicola]
MSSDIDRGVQLPGEDQIPLAPVLSSNDTGALLIVILLYVGFATVVIWALYKWFRHREVLPCVLLVAGVIAANIEPLGDHVGLIVYAPDIHWFDYWLMGRQMPSFILVAECSYVAFGCYYAYRLIEQGASFARLTFISAVLVGIPEIIVEVLWHEWGIIRYYGDNATRIFGIPLYSIVQNSTLLPFYGVVTWLGATYLKGWNILWLWLAIPTATIGYVVGVSWPVYITIQSSAPALVTWAAAIVVMVTSVAVTYAALQYPEIRERRERAARGSDPGIPDMPVAVAAGA